MLVAIAFALAAACMIGLSAQAVVSHAMCSNSPVLLNVAVSTDIAPAVQKVATEFNDQNHTSAGRCVQVQVSPEASDAAAQGVDGSQARKSGMPGFDAWIPDSSLWVDIARSFPQGAQNVQSTGISVARSPVMMVTTKTVASEMEAFTQPVGWDLLLPPSLGGPPSSLGITVDLPDPAESAAGLAATIEVSRDLGKTTAARTAFTAFVQTADTTTDTDTPGALENFVLSSNQSRGVTVASEQAVLQYDKQHPNSPLVARYPSGMNSKLGTPELDYPYVLTTSTRTKAGAANVFGNFLQSAYAQSVVRYYGFRSADGAHDAMPKSAALNSQALQVASAFSATEPSSTLQVWTKLGLHSNDLVLVDVSSAMKNPDGIGSTLEQELSATAVEGLGLFPKSTHMGQWLIGQSTSPKQPDLPVVSLGALTADVGLITREQQLLEILKSVRNFGGNPMLYQAILNAYKTMTLDYEPNAGNAVVVLTAGVDGSHDLPLSQLLTQLKALYQPSKKVEIVILQFGTLGNFNAMKQIANATGGAAYEVARPSEVKKIFFEAWSQRLCVQGCAAP